MRIFCTFKPYKMRGVALFFVFFYQFAFAEKIKILATTSILKDITKNICDTSCVVVSLLPIGADPHSYEAIPSDVYKIREADIIIKNGLGLEGWLGKLLSNKQASTVVLDASKSIEGIGNPLHENTFDPHVWMNPNLVKIQAKNIYDLLVQYDNNNAALYLNNYSKYCDELNQLDHFIRTMIAKIPTEKRVLITSHDAFSYFGAAYGIKPEGILGISTDADAQTSDIIRIRNIISKYNIPTIFVESNVNPKLIEQIAGDLQLHIGEKLYADALGDSISTANTYINMMKHNVSSIVKGLTLTQAKPMKENNYSIWFYCILIFLMVLSFIFVVKNIKQS